MLRDELLIVSQNFKEEYDKRFRNKVFMEFVHQFNTLSGTRAFSTSAIRFWLLGYSVPRKTSLARLIDNPKGWVAVLMVKVLEDLIYYNPSEYLVFQDKVDEIKKRLGTY